MLLSELGKIENCSTKFKVMEMVIDEPEHLVKKNLTFSKILPGFEYWTREGKISKIIIHKPDNPEHFGDLHRWIVFIAYDGFHDNWKMCDVVSYKEQW